MPLSRTSKPWARPLKINPAPLYLIRRHCLASSVVSVSLKLESDIVNSTLQPSHTLRGRSSVSCSRSKSLL
ncbi:hypothetical protein NDU88_006192 [Pleurodeles waltl]|uniref:Uncharacterized protein n=1 Tax=Pleurodeles waltl TaxID=8319 RepID=A0AAV7UKW5_PLEWA|nr:hypothetical protein NDU88_006192 [Pleurodeles waltl]